jgi:hypothetical protein
MAQDFSQGQQRQTSQRNERKVQHQRG